MKTARLVCFLSLIFLLALTPQIDAQITTPAASPSAKIEQTVGLTTINVEYSRPSKKDRDIFGGLVPYGEAWRTGANAATKISFSDDVMMNGQDVKAGSYAIVTKPMESEWKVMLYPYESRSWGSYRDSDVEPIMFKAATSKMPMTIETFTIAIGDLTNHGAKMWMMWDDVAATVDIGVHTDKTVEASIEKTMGGPSAGEYSAAASYYLAEGKDLNKALMWINKSIENDTREKFWILRTKSLIQAKLGMKTDAVATAKRSLELAKEAGNNDYIRMNEASIKEWSM